MPFGISELWMKKRGILRVSWLNCSSNILPLSLCIVWYLYEHIKNVMTFAKQNIGYLQAICVLFGEKEFGCSMISWICSALAHLSLRHFYSKRLAKMMKRYSHPIQLFVPKPRWNGSGLSLNVLHYSDEIVLGLRIKYFCVCFDLPCCFRHCSYTESQGKAIRQING